jgi:hypothetical protein
MADTQTAQKNQFDHSFFFITNTVTTETHSQLELPIHKQEKQQKHIINKKNKAPGLIKHLLRTHKIQITISKQ